MPTISYRLLILLIITFVLAVTPWYAVLAECQKLGVYCGKPPTDGFPGCCPFDRDANDEQVRLKCKNVENGIGTCEIVEEDPEEDPDENSGMSSMGGE